MNATIRQIRIFMAVAKELNFTAAAEKMHMTQPAFTAAITALETQFGHRLLERTTRRVKLTPAGEIFLNTASHVLNEFDTSMQRAQIAANRQQGHVNVSAPTWFLRSVASTALSNLLKTWPELTTSLYSHTAHLAIRKVLSDDLDFAICGVAIPNSGLFMARLIQDRFGVLVADNSRFSREKSLDWKDIEEENYISLDTLTGINQLLNESGVATKILRQPKSQVSSSAVMASLVKQNLGYSIVPAMTGRLILEEGLAFIPLIDPVIHRDLYLVKRKMRKLSPSAVELLRELLDVTTQVCSVADARITLSLSSLERFFDG